MLAGIGYAATKIFLAIYHLLHSGPNPRYLVSPRRGLTGECNHTVGLLTVMVESIIQGNLPSTGYSRQIGRL